MQSERKLRAAPAPVCQPNDIPEELQNAIRRREACRAAFSAYADVQTLLLEEMQRAVREVHSPETWKALARVLKTIETRMVDDALGFSQ